MIRYRIRRLFFYTFVAFGEAAKWLATDYRKVTPVERAAIFPAWAICRGGFLLAIYAYLAYCWLVY